MCVCVCATTTTSIPPQALWIFMFVCVWKKCKHFFLYTRACVENTKFYAALAREKKIGEVLWRSDPRAPLSLTGKRIFVRSRAPFMYVCVCVKLHNFFFCIYKIVFACNPFFSVRVCTTFFFSCEDKLKARAPDFFFSFLPHTRTPVSLAIDFFCVAWILFILNLGSYFLWVSFNFEETLIWIYTLNFLNFEIYT